MAKVRINPFNNKEIDFPHSNDETLQQLFDRFSESNEYVDENTNEYFAIYLDGHEIYREFWKTTRWCKYFNSY